MGEGTAVGPEGRRWWKDSLRSTKSLSAHTVRKIWLSLRRNSGAAQGIPPHAGWSFFLYEKSVLRESDSLRGRKPEVCTDLTPTPFPPLKKPLKITGIQGESLPDAPPAAHLRIRRSRIPKCVVKQRTAETRGRASRSCPSRPRRESERALKGGTASTWRKRI